jgi:hypothetical protein
MFDKVLVEHDSTPSTRPNGLASRRRAQCRVVPALS